MFRRRWMIVLSALLVALWISVLACAKFLQGRLNDRADTVAPSDVSPVSQGPPVLWPAPKFLFVDQDGQPFESSALGGHVWIADFIFTQCTTACPVMTARMRMLQQQMTDPSLRFVSFSVDPKHDTPAALLAYRTLWRGDTTRWTLLSTTPDALAATAAAMRVTVAKGTDAQNPILHSSLFELVDANGNVRGVYDSIDTAAMEKLKTDAAELGGGGGPPAAPVVTDAGATPAARGEHLYAAMGCLACHSRSTVAPPLNGLAGGLVRLSDHRTVWADDAYLHESIVDPGAKIVAGYLPVMPAYGQTLSPEQISDLIAYLHTLSTNGEGGHGEMLTAAAATQPDIPLTHDPVCRMPVRADPAGPHAVYNGQTFYFCSDDCREKFVTNPLKYLPASFK